jgi:putative SOS response-associated peptidase YedK
MRQPRCQTIPVMCGRFIQTTPSTALKERFRIAQARAEAAPRYNIAPTDPVAVVRLDEGQRVLELFRWGLVPEWAPSLREAPRLINARAESLSSKPAFRRLLPRQRCLVLADGFYEWGGSKAGKRQPYCVRLTEGGPFAFAGLFGLWRNPKAKDEPPLGTVTIVTCEPNGLIAPIHDRMPAILRGAEEEESWLDVTLTDPERLGRLLRPLPEEATDLYPVSSLVNDVKNQGPECMARIG